MDTALALLTIAAMLALGAIAFLLLTRMFKTIRDLRGVTTGLHDTMRWAVGQVVGCRRRPAATRPRTPRSRARASSGRGRERGPGARARGPRVKPRRDPLGSLRRCASRPARVGDPAHGGLQSYAAGRVLALRWGCRPLARHLHAPSPPRRPRPVPSRSRCSPRSSSRGRSAPGPAGGQDRVENCATASRASTIARAGWRAPRHGSGASSARPRARSRSSSSASRRCKARPRRGAGAPRQHRAAPRRARWLARCGCARGSRSRSDQLAELLRERYTGGRPDLLTVVLEADGFASLLETVDFLKRIQRSDEKILAAVRRGRRDAVVQRRVLTRLSVQRRRAADVVRRRHDALAAIAERAARAARGAGPRAVGAARGAERQPPQPAPRRARARQAARGAQPRDRPGRAGRAVGDPVGHRPVRVRRAEPAAQLGDGVGLLPVHHLDVEGPGRLDAARLPGVQGRAGPPRGAAVGRRARREQLGLRRARRHHLTSRSEPATRGAIRRACARTRRKWEYSAS